MRLVIPPERTLIYSASLAFTAWAPGPCAWLKDRYGLSWQIVPEVLPRLLSDPDKEASGRVMQVMMQMTKIDIAALETAYKGA